MFELIGQNHAALSKYFTYQVIEDIVLRPSGEQSRNQSLNLAEAAKDKRLSHTTAIAPRFKRDGPD